MGAVVVQFPRRQHTGPPRQQTSTKYMLEVISYKDIDGMVLIEGCIPRSCLQKIRNILDTTTQPDTDSLLPIMEEFGKRD